MNVGSNFHTTSLTRPLEKRSFTDSTRIFIYEDVFAIASYDKYLQYEYYPTIKRQKNTSAIAQVIFLSLFISEDYILAHDCTLQETQNQNSKKRTDLSGLNLFIEVSRVTTIRTRLSSSTYSRK